MWETANIILVEETSLANCFIEEYYKKKHDPYRDTIALSLLFFSRDSSEFCSSRWGGG